MLGKRRFLDRQISIEEVARCGAARWWLLVNHWREFKSQTYRGNGEREGRGRWIRDPREGIEEGFVDWGLLLIRGHLPKSSLRDKILAIRKGD